MTKWREIATRPYTLFKAEPEAVAFAKSLNGVLLIPTDKEGRQLLYWDGAGLENFGKVIIERTKHEKGFIETHIKDCYKTCESFVKTCREIGRKTTVRTTPRRLLNFYLRYYGKHLEYTYFLVVPAVIEQALTPIIQKWLLRTLTRQGKPELFQECFNALSINPKQVEATKEQIDLLKIAIKIEENGGTVSHSLDKKIDLHVRKYSWIPVYDVTDFPWNKARFITALKEVSQNPKRELEKLQCDLEERQRRSQKVTEDLSLKGDFLNMVKMLQEYIFLRTYRTDALRKAMFYLGPFVIELGRRAGLKTEEVAYFSKNELKAFLLGGKLPERTKILERKSHYLLLIRSGKQQLVSDGKIIGRIIRQEVGVEKRKEELIQGVVACRGRARGMVKIINSVEETEKMKKGDILVSRMTFPDLMLAIRKAAAIVTDEGGITCHAAIVSREFGIPCIVSTRIATKILKDGDWVEVDAGEGIIKRLS